jgi:hypothetical protein
MRKGFHPRVALLAGHIAVESLRKNTLFDKEARRIFPLRETGLRHNNHHLPLLAGERSNMLLVMAVQATLVSSSFLCLARTRF